MLISNLFLGRLSLLNLLIQYLGVCLARSYMRKHQIISSWLSPIAEQKRNISLVAQETMHTMQSFFIHRNQDVCSSCWDILHIFFIAYLAHLQVLHRIVSTCIMNTKSYHSSVFKSCALPKTYASEQV